MRTWARTITGLRPIVDGIYDGELTLEQGRDQLVTLLRQDPDYDDVAIYGTRQAVFSYIVDDDIADATDQKDFDYALEALYDWADDHDVWIDPTE